MRTIEREVVGIFFVSNDNHILLGKGGVYKGTWIVPGGGIDEGESMLEALKREAYEELNVDISGYDIEPINLQLTGESEKILRHSGEKVLVKMVFHNFLVRASKPAREIQVICEDDFVLAKWQPIRSLETLKIAEPTKTVLKKLGYI